jgi:head-tail adaptor
MANIGGNIKGTIQRKTVAKNAIGEQVEAWTDAFAGVRGWLGLQSGDSKRTTFNAKLEESTHVFLCDFSADIYALTIQDEETQAVPDCRMILKGMVYDVLLIDNPDEMNEQLEIYLRKVGAWHG